MAKKVVLAYSGGLDTSIMVKWLIDNYNLSASSIEPCEVIAYVADVGQQDDFSAIEKKAKKSGATKVYVKDLKEEFAANYLFPLLKSGAVYESGYLLGTAIARPLIAKYQVEVAKAEKADCLAHGATGKGNDQVRFELTYKALAPNLEIIAPWRIWELKGREEEIGYAKRHKIPVPVTKTKPYSSDQNLWHTSFEGGILEDPAKEPPENMFVMTTAPEKAPNHSTYLEIAFIKGVPVKVNGQKLGACQLIKELNEIGGKNGVGRVDMVENRLVGIKSRGVYETPGGTILLNAHKALEALTLDRETLHYKQLVSQKYAALVYNGQWFTPIREALDAFINQTQKNVTGSVRLKLYKGNCVIVGRKSPFSLYDPKLATFEKEAIYNQKDAEGFINLFGLPLKVEALRRKK